MGKGYSREQVEAVVREVVEVARGQVEAMRFDVSGLAARLDALSERVRALEAGAGYAFDVKYVPARSHRTVVFDFTDPGDECDCGFCTPTERAA